LTSSLAGSLAKTYLPPAVVPVYQALARVFGLRCCASLARFGLRMSLPRTPRCFALAGSEPSSRAWPAWGIAARGVCSELGTSVRLTDETGCGSLLPTPTGAGNENSPSMQKWAGHRNLAMLTGTSGTGKMTPSGPCRTPMRPTPIASDRNGDRQRGAGSIARGGGRRLTLDMLPTPTATLYGSNQGGAAGRTGKKRLSLEGRTGGVFIALREWMMGFPIGWTASEPLATGRFQRWLRSHGAY
jgi:hypothetical protein